MVMGESGRAREAEAQIAPDIGAQVAQELRPLK
jgi:hypothetical protein